MPNILTKLQPTLFSAAQTVSREPWGVMDSIRLDFDNKGVAKGDEVTVPVAPTRAASDFTPAATPPQGDDATADDVKVQITKARKVSWYLTGEQRRSLENGNTNAEWIRQLMMQGMRTLRNEAEIDSALAVKQGASRAIGTAGGSPFASDINALVDARKILRDNGAPLADAQCVMDTTDGGALRKLAIIQQADQAGSPEERRSGNLDRQFGFLLRESAGIELHSAGTGTGYLTNGAVAEDSQSIVVDTGTGDFNAGDVVTIDGNKYVVSGALDGTTLSVNRPGAVATIANDTAVSEDGDYTPILCFERDAIVGITRPPILPPNPTMQQVMISDDEGNTFLLVEIAQYGQVSWELHLAWGFKAVQKEHIALILS